MTAETETTPGVSRARDIIDSDYERLGLFLTNRFSDCGLLGDATPVDSVIRLLSLHRVSGLLHHLAATDQLHPDPVVFEAGRCYRHESGRIMRVLGSLPAYGDALLVEKANGAISPLSVSEDATHGWHEISDGDWQAAVGVVGGMISAQHWREAMQANAGAVIDAEIVDDAEVARRTSAWLSFDHEVLEHDHKGYSEEKCVRCGWVMGTLPLNCQNDNSPHLFPSQIEMTKPFDARAYLDGTSGVAAGEGVKVGDVFEIVDGGRRMGWRYVVESGPVVGGLWSLHRVTPRPGASVRRTAERLLGAGWRRIEDGDESWWLSGTVLATLQGDVTIRPDRDEPSIPKAGDVVRVFTHPSLVVDA